jgi:putative tricarboxylic transport membrane protein
MIESIGQAIELLYTTPIAIAAIAGVAWGILGGALPGISPSISMALLLPFTYGMDPGSAVVLLAATYLGAEYGGSIPAILINTPGTNAAAATVLDGYPLHVQGRGGEALGISLYSAVIGGFFGLLMLSLLTRPLADLALAFTPMSYFALGILGLSVIASLAGASLLKGIIAAVLGLMVATVGTDPISGVPRFTFGRPELLDGIAPILIMVGLFAVSELFRQAAAGVQQVAVRVRARVSLPTASVRRRLIKPQLIGTSIGTIEGVIPGAGGTIASFLAYNEARRFSRHKEEFGHGSPEGIAAPETANNTVASTALVPLLSFGIPGSNSAAILLGGLLVHGLTPGPRLFEENGEMITGLYTGLFIANLSLLAIGVAILPLCLWLVNRSKALLMAFIYALIFSGIYSINESLFDIAIVLGAGLAGYFMRLVGLPLLPAVLGVVLGFLVESNYRRSLVLSGGDHRIFLEDPIAVGLLITAAVFIFGSLAMRAWRGGTRGAGTSRRSGDDT